MGYIQLAMQAWRLPVAQAQMITPFLWFDGRAVEAANFYAAIFPNSRVLAVNSLTAGPAEGNTVVEFCLAGQNFTALDGGPMFQFSPAISFVVHCENQEEVDYYWDCLSRDGAPEQCGWLRDKFGVSWQIVPTALGQLIEQGGEAVMSALLQMVKIDIGQLEAAAGQP